MKIRNINGTSQNTCSCGTWLNHWKKFSNQFLVVCPVIGCSKTDILGAHVQRANSLDNKWYICPLCSKHNMATYELEIADATKLVSANKKETCEK